jgi:hypothetical protein
MTKEDCGHVTGHFRSRPQLSVFDSVPGKGGTRSGVGDVKNSDQHNDDVNGVSSSWSTNKTTEEVRRVVMVSKMFR